MKRKWILYALSAFIIVFILFFININSSNNQLKSEFYNLINDFIVSIQENRTQDAIDSIYFTEQARLVLYDLTFEGFDEWIINSYTINELNKLNDYVYRFDIDLYNDYEHIKFEPFIAYIDEQWQIVLNHRFIPSDVLGDVYIEVDPDEIPFENIVWD